MVPAVPGNGHPSAPNGRGAKVGGRQRAKPRGPPAGTPTPCPRGRDGRRAGPPAGPARRTGDPPGGFQSGGGRAGRGRERSGAARMRRPALRGGGGCATPPALTVRARKERGEGHSPESPNTSTLTLSKAAILLYLATTPETTSFPRRRQWQRTLLTRSLSLLAAGRRYDRFNSCEGGNAGGLYQDAIGSFPCRSPFSHEAGRLPGTGGEVVSRMRGRRAVGRGARRPADVTGARAALTRPHGNRRKSRPEPGRAGGGGGGGGRSVPAPGNGGCRRRRRPGRGLPRCRRGLNGPESPLPLRFPGGARRGGLPVARGSPGPVSPFPQVFWVPLTGRARRPGPWSPHVVPLGRCPGPLLRLWLRTTACLSLGGVCGGFLVCFGFFFFFRRYR